MKKLFVAILLLMGLLFFNMKIYASSLLGITHEKSIQLASKEKEDKDDKVKKGKASREEGFDGKASRKKGKDGKASRGKSSKK